MGLIGLITLILAILAQKEDCSPPFKCNEIYTPGRYIASRSKYSGSSVYYYANSVATFQLLLRAGDIALNPGPSALRNSTVTHVELSSDQPKGHVTGLVFNARSIRHKMPDLLAHLASCHAEIICILESWVNSTCEDVELDFPSMSYYARTEHAQKTGWRSTNCHRC